MIMTVEVNNKKKKKKKKKDECRYQYQDIVSCMYVQPRRK